MTQTEIISIIPDKFAKELIDRKIYNRVIEIMMQQIETLDELNRIKTNVANIQDFPVFMTRAFHWKSTREKYTGWFKIVFNKDFYEERKTAGSASEDHIAGRALSLGDIYHTNTARTFDKCAKELKYNTINGEAENRKE
jgi:hypothetical protein